MNFQIPDKKFKYILLSILFIVFVIVINRPIEIWNDSEGYLHMDIYRSAGYPIFLWVLKSVSASHLDILTIVFQITIGLIAIYIFITRLKTLLNIHPILFLFLTLIIATPYVYNHKLANNYLSESLTYSLYLLAIVLLIEGLVLNKLKSLWISIPILIVLFMFRSQFLFIVPVALLIILWLVLKHKEKKKYLVIGLAFIVLPFFTSLLDKTFHYVKHGYFVNTPWTGIPLSTPAYYVADEQDYLLYDSEFEQQFFKSIYTQLINKNLNIHHLKEDKFNDESSFYILHFSEISNRTLYDYGKELVGPKISESEKFIALDELTKKMVLPLVLDNFGLWLKVYIKNIVNGFGNSKYLLLYVILLIFGLSGMVKKHNEVYKTVSLLLILTFGNIALVALGMHTIKRFTFYNDWVVFLVLFILMDDYVKQRKSLS
jgi:O-antigen ligase